MSLRALHFLQTNSVFPKPSVSEVLFFNLTWSGTSDPGGGWANSFRRQFQPSSLIISVNEGDKEVTTTS